MIHKMLNYEKHLSMKNKTVNYLRINFNYENNLSVACNNCKRNFVLKNYIPAAQSD